MPPAWRSCGCCGRPSGKRPHEGGRGICPPVRGEKGQPVHRGADRPVPPHGGRRGAAGLQGRRLLRQEHRASRLSAADEGHPRRPHRHAVRLPAGQVFPQRGGLRSAVGGAAGAPCGVRVGQRELRHQDTHGAGHAAHHHGVRPAGAGDHRGARAGQLLPPRGTGRMAGRPSTLRLRQRPRTWAGWQGSPVPYPQRQGGGGAADLSGVCRRGHVTGAAGPQADRRGNPRPQAHYLGQRDAVPPAAQPRLCDGGRAGAAPLSGAGRGGHQPAGIL